MGHINLTDTKQERERVREKSETKLGHQNTTLHYRGRRGRDADWTGGVNISKQMKKRGTQLEFPSTTGKRGLGEGEQLCGSVGGRGLSLAV